ncbi:alkanesulfonate monooxygenase [Pleomassaria siparia CBS 279.74]|uniref:Alkanesulfonate monooxygenase n=1 Tax=Pleomassaria siparia CBS 279.74 TaxID=1314801 RepID=A0A6G1JQ59_9PLEO|nr:alkanesulfonate monooxygenase [Pleomassaria siparia CBS 279.74]
MSDPKAEKPTKQWILNAFTMSTPGHLASGLWRHPRNRSSEYTDIEYWTDLAKVLEAGKFHGLFIADVLGHYGVYGGAGNIDRGLPGAAQFPISDPLQVLPIAAMAAVTKHLSFGITASTTYENPFLLARRFATLDHLTKGRVAWNAVTSHLESAARNVGLETQIPHDERYAMADEFLTATYKLWEGSWRDDAVVKDAEARRYTVPGRVRGVDHVGKYFKTAGPLTTEPSLQRTPFIFQAGTSTAGKAFATKHAECMFLAGMTPQSVRKSVDEIRHLATTHGRPRTSIKLIAGILIIVAETDELARAKYEEYLSYADLEGSLTLFGGWTGTDLSLIDDDDDLQFTGPGAIQSLVSSWTATVPGTKNTKWTKARVAQELAIGGAHARAIGSPTTVADVLQTWITEADIDGFNVSYAVNPGDFEDILRWLLPELRRRGVFWETYLAGTTRENYSADGLGPRLREDHPGAQYKWPAE